jgi:hypothetical protein
LEAIFERRAEDRKTLTLEMLHGDAYPRFIEDEADGHVVAIPLRIVDGNFLDELGVLQKEEVQHA